LSFSTSTDYFFFDPFSASTTKISASIRDQERFLRVPFAGGHGMGFKQTMAILRKKMWDFVMYGSIKLETTSSVMHYSKLVIIIEKQLYMLRIHIDVLQSPSGQKPVYMSGSVMDQTAFDVEMQRLFPHLKHFLTAFKSSRKPILLQLLTFRGNIQSSLSSSSSNLNLSIDDDDHILDERKIQTSSSSSSSSLSSPAISDVDIIWDALISSHYMFQPKSKILFSNLAPFSIPEYGMIRGNFPTSKLSKYDVKNTADSVDSNNPFQGEQTDVLFSLPVEPRPRRHNPTLIFINGVPVFTADDGRYGSEVANYLIVTTDIKKFSHMTRGKDAVFNAMALPAQTLNRAMEFWSTTKNISADVTNYVDSLTSILKNTTPAGKILRDYITSNEFKHRVFDSDAEFRKIQRKFYDARLVNNQKDLMKSWKIPIPNPQLDFERVFGEFATWLTSDQDYSSDDYSYRRSPPRVNYLDLNLYMIKYIFAHTELYKISLMNPEILAATSLLRPDTFELPDPVSLSLLHKTFYFGLLAFNHFMSTNLVELVQLAALNNESSKSEKVSKECIALLFRAKRENSKFKLFCV
jgi:hypothetical protein